MIIQKSIIHFELERAIETALSSSVTRDSVTFVVSEYVFNTKY